MFLAEIYRVFFSFTLGEIPLKGLSEKPGSLFGLKFWTFNLGDNRPNLEPVFGVEGRSIHLLVLWKLVVYKTLVSVELKLFKTERKGKVKLYLKHSVFLFAYAFKNYFYMTVESYHFRVIFACLAIMREKLRCLLLK